MTPIPEPKIYKEVYKTNFELFKQTWVWDVRREHPIQLQMLCDDCNPKKKREKILREEMIRKKKEEYRRKHPGKRRRSNRKAEPGHWI
jgi:hypothetical protein